MTIAPHSGIVDFGTFTPPAGGGDGIQGEVPAPLTGQETYVLTATGWATGGGGGTVTQINTGTGLSGGPITTSGTISLANTTVTPASYTNANITVDAQGRITSAANGSAGGVTSVTASSPIASSGGATPDISLTGIIAGTYGGTGVNNGSKTITIGGNFTTSGAFTTTLTATANTSVTLPVSGTLISSVTNMAANPVTGTPSSSTYLRGDGTWAATPAASLTIGTTTTSGGAAGQIMFDTGSVLQESSSLLWDNTNKALTLTSIANPIVPTLTLAGGSGITGTALSGVSITGTGGQFSCNAASLAVGQFVTISGTLGGTGTITGYVNPTTYLISATNGSTTFTLVVSSTGAAIVTTAGTPTGLTYTVTAPVINISETWNNSSALFTALKLNVTDTASNASSLLMDLQVGGSSKFSVSKIGTVTLAGTGSIGSGDTLSITSKLKATNFFLNNNTGGFLGSFGNSNSGAGTFIGWQTYAAVMTSGFTLQWSNVPFGTSLASAVGDTFIGRRAAANIMLGNVDASSPVAQTLSVQSVVAGTTNTAGQNLTITGSQGTGTGIGGDIIFQVAPAGTTGTAQNALVQGLRIYNNQTVVIGKAYTVATLPTAGTQGRKAWVTDATAPIFLGALTGGGAVVTPVFDNGTAWVAG